jgi:subfamily B ATP-binding cassette protein MsbA
LKTYWRILAFSRPYKRFLPAYLITAVLAITFGLMNFTLIIPLLNVLFNQEPQNPAFRSATEPEFSLTIDYVKELFNFHLGNVIREHGKVGALRFVCVLLVCSILLSNLFRYLSYRLLTVARSQLVYNLRQRVFDQMTRLHLGYFSNERKGDLMSRLTSDVQEVEYSVTSTLTVLFREPVTIIAFFILLFSISAKLTLFTLILLPVSGGMIALLAKQLRKRSLQGQETVGSLLGVIDETLGGMRVIKGFNAGPFVRDKFDRLNQSYASLLRSIENRRDLASPMSEVLGVIVITGILLYGGTLVLEGRSELTASEFIGYLVLFSQVLVPAKSLSSSFSNIQRGLAASDRLLQIINTPSDVKDKPGAEELPDFKDSIELQNVSFRYGQEPVLQEINLRIGKGKTIALVGPSGSGKSTLADLIPRFYDPTEGRILMDGHDLREITLASLRSKMGIVTQESVLFNDTIFNNIAFNFPNPTQEQVEQAARIANAHEFIAQTPDGYLTMIGDRGAKLSGGQRQRLNIARAVLHNPPILILDEATSALDTESEKLVQEALTRLMEHRTSLVIAHRMSTVQHADEIIVLQAGRIVQRGTHRELQQQEGLYKRLIQMQLG